MPHGIKQNRYMPDKRTEMQRGASHCRLQHCIIALIRRTGTYSHINRKLYKEALQEEIKAPPLKKSG
jgi:hypothetical protein